MHILCIADEKDPLVYSQQVAQRYKDVDFVLSAGDLPLNYYEFIVSALNKPLYFIFGNHQIEHLKHFKKNCLFDDPYVAPYGVSATQLSFGGTYIDGKIKREKSTGLLLAGLGGSLRYNTQENQFTEFQMYWRICKMIPALLFNRLRHGRFLDILITHAPPRGIGDLDDRCHTGFGAFLWFMRRFKPRYLIHGHIHLLDMNTVRQSRYYDTEVINVYGSYVLQEDT